MVTLASRRAPWLLRTAAALLWLTVLVLVLEVWGAARMRAWEARGQAYTPTRGEEAMAREAAIWHDYGREPISVGADLEARRAFQALVPEGRAAFARERHELVALCDAAGKVTTRYVDSAHPQLAPLAQRIPPGVPVWAMLGEVEAADARQTVALTANSGAFQSREYPVAVPGNESYIAQFYFWPYPDAAEHERIGVFVRDSMWAVLWERFRPHVHQNDSYDFRTNSQGWRDEEVALPKPAGQVRIACIGGSTTAEGPTNHLTYPNILETKLRRHFETEAIEVVNCGVWALSTNQERAQVGEYLALEPGLLVHYNLVNDIVYRLPDWLRASGPREGLPWLKQFLREESHFGYFYLNAWLVPPRETLEQLLREHVLGDLEAIRAAAAGAGVPLGVCSFACPDIEHLPPSERAHYDHLINTMQWSHVIDAATYAEIVGLYNELLRQWCTETGVLYIPVAEYVRGGTDIFTDICHMTLPGIEAKADAVARALIPWVAQHADWETQPVDPVPTGAPASRR